VRSSNGTLGSPRLTLLHFSCQRYTARPSLTQTALKAAEKKIDISGKYTINYGTRANSNGTLYQLTAKPLQSALLLISMDNNVLHFTDANRAVIIGNAGCGLRSAEATVYELSYDNGSLYLQKGDENILFFLDPDKKPMVGN
jgi:hypothetical protein